MRRNFPTLEALAEVEETQAYAEIHHMLRKSASRTAGPLRPGGAHARDHRAAARASLHEAFRAEAHDHQTSMNKLCISKLLRFVDGDLVPEQH